MQFFGVHIKAGPECQNHVRSAETEKVCGDSMYGVTVASKKGYNAMSYKNGLFCYNNRDVTEQRNHGYWIE